MPVEKKEVEKLAVDTFNTTEEVNAVVGKGDGNAPLAFPIS
jgi:hypothetical protein